MYLEIATMICKEFRGEVTGPLEEIEETEESLAGKIVTLETRFQFTLTQNTREEQNLQF